MAMKQQEKLGSPSLGASGSVGEGRRGAGLKNTVEEAVVLMPTKIETVEISIPLRVYPSATPFRSPASTFMV